MNRAALVLAFLVGTCAYAVPVTPPTKVLRVEGRTEYQFPLNTGVQVNSDQLPPLVVVVPDTTVPMQRIVIVNKTPPAPAPVVVTKSLIDAILPGGVKTAKEALAIWPFASVLEKADTAFVVPETVKLDKSSDVSLVIDLTGQGDAVQSELSGSNKKGEKIEIARVVVAKILAPDFDVIEVINDGRQVLNTNGPTEWRWKITPKKIGAYKVNVTVSAVVEIGNDRAERLIKVFNEEVTVFVTPADAARYFFSKNWQWLWSTLVLPFGLWIWKSKKKKSVIANEDPEPAADPE